MIGSTVFQVTLLLTPMDYLLRPLSLLPTGLNQQQHISPFGKGELMRAGKIIAGRWAGQRRDCRDPAGRRTPHAREFSAAFQVAHRFVHRGGVRIVNGEQVG